MIRVSRKSKVLSKFLIFLGVLGSVFYPVVINPFREPEKYREIQRVTRKNIKREDIQPGNMNIWRDPFAANTTKLEQNQEK